MAAAAKKFVKVTDLKSVFNYISGRTSATSIEHFDYSTLKAGITVANENSILFIEDTVATGDGLGKWIWAQGKLYSGNDASKFTINGAGDTWVGATAMRDGDYGYKVNVWHKDVTRAADYNTGATTTAKFKAVTGVTSDAKGHLTRVITTEITIPAHGATGDGWIKVGKTGSAEDSTYIFNHLTQFANSTGASTSKTVQSIGGQTGNAVIINTPSMQFDKAGHLTTLTGVSFVLTAADFGLASAMHFIGATGGQIIENPPASGINNGDVVVINGPQGYTGKGKEFVWTSNGWVELGDESRYLEGASGDQWINAQENNNMVLISHKSGQTATQGITGKVISDILYDDKGHVVYVGYTGTRNSNIGATGNGTNKGRIRMTGEDGGYVDIQGWSGIQVQVTDPGTNKGVINIFNTDGISLPGVAGSTYKIADIYLSGATKTIIGKDTTYTLGRDVTSSVGATESYADLKVQLTPSLGGATSTIDYQIYSVDHSIVMGKKIVGGEYQVTLDYTGVSTPDDWATIPAS